MGFVVTAATARDLSELIRNEFPDPGGDDELQPWLDLSYGLLTALTGRQFGSATDFPSDTEAVPDWLAPVAQRGVVMKVEQEFSRFGGSQEDIEEMMGSGNLRSFTAGPYSESYFGPAEAVQAKVLDPDPRLNEILWALCTESKREEWLALWTGQHAPEAVPQAFRWDLRPGGY